MPGANDRQGRREKRAQARSDVLRSALALATDRPFRDVTVDEIARAAGISRSAFYTRFGDKHELMLDAVDEVAADLDAVSSSWWQDPGPPAERVRTAIEAVVSVYAEHASLLMVVTEVSTYDDEVRGRWFSIIERLIEAAAGHLRSEQRAGLIGDLLEPRATAECLVLMIERCCYVYLARGERSPREVVTACAPVWTGALYPGVIPAEHLRPG